jgi:lipoprotein-releasing system permease protein
LNLEFFIAKRLNKTNQGRKHFSNSITNIVIAGIVLSTAVMIASVAIVTGFKEEIRNKVVGFGSHIQILNYDSNLSYQTRPVPSDLEILDEVRKHPGVKHVQPFSIIAGVVKTETDIQGLVLKGVDSAFDWNFFESSLIEGSSFGLEAEKISNQIVVSSFLANKLRLSVGDEFQMWFVDERPRFRKFTISGIYETSLAEFDETFALVDIRHVERLNNWEEGEISGYEIILEDFNTVEEVSWDIRGIVAGY